MTLIDDVKHGHQQKEKMPEHTVHSFGRLHQICPVHFYDGLTAVLVFRNMIPTVSDHQYLYIITQNVEILCKSIGDAALLCIAYTMNSDDNLVIVFMI